ncbi:MAG: hypothetical protein OHK0039_10030 [Bacteroidia bacterium]
MSILKSTLLFGATFLFSILGIELFLQTAEIDLSYHELHPRLGKKIQADKRIIMIKEGLYMGRSNSYGYLGPDYGPDKPVDVYRIALMGDSYAEGFQLFEQYHFRSILERELAASTGRKIEVLNFGSGNFNFHDMHLYYRNFAQGFHPDLVLYVVKPESFAERDNYFIPSPYFKLEQDRLTIDYSFTEQGTFKSYTRFKWLFENSSLLKMAQNAYKLASKGRTPVIVFDKFYKAIYYTEANKTDPEEVVEDPEITPVTEAILDEIGAEGKSIFLYRKRYSESLKDYIASQQIPAIDLNDTLDVLMASGVHPRYWQASNKKGHWNHAAHLAIGHYLAHRLAPRVMGLVEPPLRLPETLPAVDTTATDSSLSVQP